MIEDLWARIYIVEVLLLAIGLCAGYMLGQWDSKRMVKRALLHEREEQDLDP